MGDPELSRQTVTFFLSITVKMAAWSVLSALEIRRNGGCNRQPQKPKTTVGPGCHFQNEKVASTEIIWGV